MSGDAPGGPPAVTDEFSIAQHLERGRYGVAYFREFTALYQKLEPVGDVTVGVEGRLSEQAGMDLARLQECIDAVEEASTVAAAQIDEQTNQIQRIPDAWSGSASTDAQAMLGRQVEQAESVHEQVSAACDALRAARVAFRDAVRAKADVCVGFREQDSTGVRSRLLIQGRSSAELGKLIDVWQGNPAYNELLEAAAIMYRNDDRPQASSSLTPIGGDSLAQTVKRDSEYWALIFRTDFEAKLNAFNAVCDSTDATIKAQYSALIRALGDISTKPFPMPSGAGVPSERAVVEPFGGGGVDVETFGGGGSVGGATRTGGPSAGGSYLPEYGETVERTMPEPIAQVVPTQSLSGIGALVDVAAKATELVAGVALGVVDGALKMVQDLTDGQDLTDNAVFAPDISRSDIEREDIEPADIAPAASEAAFDVAGHRLVITAGVDGELLVTGTGPDGEAKRFTLTIDENGVPAIEPVEPEAEFAVVDEPAAHVEVVDDGATSATTSEALAIEPVPETAPEPVPETIMQPVPVTVHPEPEEQVRQTTSGNDRPGVDPGPESGAQVAEAGSM